MDVTDITDTAKRILELTAQHTLETSSPITPALRRAEESLADRVPERELRIAARMAAAATSTAGAYTIQALRDPTVRVAAINRAINMIGAGAEKCSDDAQSSPYPDCRMPTCGDSPPSSHRSRTRQTRRPGAWLSAWTLMMRALHQIHSTRTRYPDRAH